MGVWKERWEKNEFSINVPREHFVSDDLTPQTASILVYNPYSDFSSLEYNYTLVKLLESIDLKKAELISSLKRFFSKFLKPKMHES